MQFIKRLRTKTYNILRWSEKYTQTDMIYLTKGGFWLTFSQIISSVSVFLLAVAFANLLPKETYGVYKYILSIAGILSIFTLPRMGTAITQAAARNYEGSFSRAVRTKIKWGLLAGLASLILAGYYYLNNNSTLTISFLIAAIFLPFFDTFDIYNAFLRGKKLFKFSAKYQIISHLSSVAVLIITLFLTKNIFLILLSYFIPWTILRYIFFKTTLKKFPPNQNVDPQTISYGKHLTLINAIGVIATHVDKILIFHYLGVVELAIYAFATAIPERIKGLSSTLAVLIFPKFSERNVEEIKAGIKSKFIKLFFLSALVVGSYILAAPFIYNTFFPQYKESIFYSQLLALSMLNASFLPADIFLAAKKKTKEQYLSSFFQSIFKIITMVIFILWYGLLGLIIAIILSRFLGSLVNLALYYRSSSDTEK